MYSVTMGHLTVRAESSLCGISGHRPGTFSLPRFNCQLNQELHELICEVTAYLNIYISTDLLNFSHITYFWLIIVLRLSIIALTLSEIKYHLMSFKIQVLCNYLSRCMTFCSNEYISVTVVLVYIKKPNYQLLVWYLNRKVHMNDSRCWWWWWW